MSAEFLDSNVLIYLLSEGAKRARAEQVLQVGGVISVQVLNEVANVCRKKLKMAWGELDELLRTLQELCTVESLTLESHAQGLALCARYSLSIYDGQIVSSALLAGCTTLWSEDMQDGLVVDGLTIRNPF